MKVEKVKIGEVKNNPSNPRLIKDDKFRKLVKSIQEFPQMLELRPIVVDENNIVLGGNMRLKACKEAGLKDVFIVKAENLTEEQKQEFIVKDNVGFGEWDWDMLANEWDVEKIQDWGLDLPVDLTVTELEAEEDDFVIPDVIETDIVLGDLFEIAQVTSGGFKDRELKLLTVRPTGALLMGSRPVITVTPVGNRPSASRKAFELSCNDMSIFN